MPEIMELQGTLDQVLDNKALSRMAGEWLTFERLCQVMLKGAAPDPRTFAVTDRNVANVVIKMLEANLSSEQHSRIRFCLIRALEGHPDYAHSRRYQAEEQNVINDPKIRSAHEALLRAENDVFARWYEFKAGMDRAETRVCQIHIDNKFAGTGFLVGKSQVLTTFHAIADLVNENNEPYISSNLRLKCVFDDVLIPGVVSSTYRLEASVTVNWLLAMSRPDQHEWHVEKPRDELDPNHLDFAVIQLSDPIGNTAPKYQKGAARGWINLNTVAAEPEQDAQMLLAHFPAGVDLRLCVGLFDIHSKCRSRIRYMTPTIIGSSGSPCFNVKWEPYAMHNAGYKAVSINQGVPLNLIRAAINPRIFSDTAAAPPLFSAITAENEPILARKNVQSAIESLLRNDSRLTTLVISSKEKGGKSYTADLILNALSARGVRAYLLDATSFSSDTAEAFAVRLIETILGSYSEKPILPPDTRQRARWISHELASWTLSGSKLEKSVANIGGLSEPLWILLDCCDKVGFSQDVRDLIIALTGIDSEESWPIRLILFGYDKSIALAAPTRVVHAPIDLVTGESAYPFMEFTFEQLGIVEDKSTLKNIADDFAAIVKELGLESVANYVLALKTWASRRKSEMEAKGTL